MAENATAAAAEIGYSVEVFEGFSYSSKAVGPFPHRLRAGRLELVDFGTTAYASNKLAGRQW
jgi:hypothetical protein